MPGIGGVTISPLIKLGARRSLTVEYKAVLDAMTTQPDKSDQLLYDQFIRTIKQAGIWDKLDVLRIYGNSNNDGAAAFLNWKNPGTYNGTPHNLYTFTSKRGIIKYDNLFYIDSNYNPSTADGNLNQNDISIGFFSLTPDQSGFDIGCTDATATLALSANYNNNIYSKINNNTALVTSNDNATGIYSANRLGNDITILRNKIKVIETSNVSIALPNKNIYEFAYNNNGTDASWSKRELFCSYWGAYLTQEQQEIFSDAINELYWSLNTVDSGLSELATASENVLALQSAVDGGFKRVSIQPGTYDLNDTILLDSNTEIKGLGTVTLNKSEAYAQIFLNRGATTDTYNDSITLDKLNLKCNSSGNDSILVYGLRAQLGFYKIRDLNIKNITGTYAGSNAYFGYIVDFIRARFTNISLTSSKDGINLAAGHDAIYDNVTFGTYDDAIALAGVAFPKSCVKVGDLYNIIIKNCNDIVPDGQVEAGYFCRAMGAAWTDWTSGNTYKTGELCKNDANLYQCNNDNAFSAIAANAPVHTDGEVTGADGITWRYVQPAPANDYVKIYNITFDGCASNKKRPVIYGNNYIGDFLWAVTPGQEVNTTLENVIINNHTFSPLSVSPLTKSDGSLVSISLLNSVIDNANYLHYNYNYNDTISFIRNIQWTISGNNINGSGGYFRSKMSTENIVAIGSGNTVSEPRNLNKQAGEDATFRINNDSLLLFSYDLADLSPVDGDYVLTENGLYQYVTDTWVLS